MRLEMLLDRRSAWRDRMAPVRVLFVITLLSVGSLPTSLMSTVDGAVSLDTLEEIRENRIQIDPNRCDIPSKGTGPTVFKINDVPTDLVIASSRRPFHMIVSNVLRIILRDHLGIDRVVVRRLDPESNEFDQTEVLAQIRSNEVSRIPEKGDTLGHLPDALINVEVWRDSGYGADHGFSNKHSVFYAGSYAAQGLFGWWIPLVWMNSLPNVDGVPWDHYIILTMKQKVKSLSISSADLDPVIPDETSCESLKNHESLRPLLKSWKCNGKVLVSPVCANSQSSCATLLAADPLQQIGRGNVAELLSAQIEGISGGLVNLAFLGSNFDAFLLKRLDSAFAKTKGTLFFNWTPNTKTACDKPGGENLTLSTPYEARSLPKRRISCVSKIR